MMIQGAVRKFRTVFGILCGNNRYLSMILSEEEKRIRDSG